MTICNRGGIGALAFVAISMSGVCCAQTPAPPNLQLLTPVSLPDCIRLALQNSPKLKIAKADRTISRIQANRESPTSSPTLTATVSGTLQGPSISYPYPGRNPAIVLPAETVRLDLIAEQILYRPGFKAAKQRYQSLLSLADLDYFKAATELTLSIYKAYIDALRAESGLKIAEEGRESALAFQKLVLKQIETGHAKPVDAETVKAQVAESESGRTQAEGGLELARLNLNRLTGDSIADPTKLATISEAISIPENSEAAVRNALANRVELRSLAEGTISAKAGVSLSNTRLQPILSLKGQLSEATPSAFQHEHYASASLELKLPILDGGKSRLNAEEAKAQQLKLIETLEEAKAGIQLEVRQAWLKLREAEAKIAQTETQAAGMQATEIVAEKAYEVGLGSVIEVRNAQREVRTVRERGLIARYDLLSANAEFRFAQGTLLDPKSLPKLLSGGKKQ